MNESASELHGVAAELTTAAGLPRPRTLVRLAGGKNNRVFRVALYDGTDVVLKLYHADPRDLRDRLGAEWAFLKYVWGRGVRNVPQPLARSTDRHAGLYGFAAGRRLAADEVDCDAVRQAGAFIEAINREPRRPEVLVPGAEACFSLGQHLASVERRVARLDDLNAASPNADKAAAMVERRLKPIWRATSKAIEDAAKRFGTALEQPIGTACMSPSDFGFHNALFDATQNAIFIDFEYAGRDDPAKLVCDFFCQPEVPVPLVHFDSFSSSLAGVLGLDEADLWRCRVLLPAYRLKWVCIILNEFLPIGASRRAFASDDDQAERTHLQLERAERQLDLVSLKP